MAKDTSVRMDRYRLMALVVRCYETATDDIMEVGTKAQVRAKYRAHVKEILNDEDEDVGNAEIDRITDLLMAVKGILDKDV